MNLVRIIGPDATVSGLQDIVDLILVLASGRRVTATTVRVGAYASDRAITEIQARGATVTVLKDNTALQQQLDRLYALIPDDESPVG